MKTFSLSDGNEIPGIGLGTWKSAPGEVGQAIRWALEAGYRHIDCAAIYQNETEIGEAFKDCLKKKTAHRDHLFITSKLWNNAHRPEDVIPALKKTLFDLQLDHLDLYLMHWPVASKAEVIFPQSGADQISLDALPVEATWEAMEEAVKHGLTKSIGVSNFSVTKLKKLIAASATPPVVNQVELHPYLAQQELLNYCKSENIHLTAYSPLGSTDRSADMKKKDEPSLLENPLVNTIAREKDASAAQVLLSWHLHRGCSAIPKSTNKERLTANLQSATVELTAEDMTRLAALDQHYRFVDGKFFEFEGGPYRNVFDE